MSEERGDPAVSIPGKEARPARLLLLRHGAAEGSGEGRFFGRTDVDLLPGGEAQMREAAPRLAPWLKGGGGVRAFTSPLRRARRSALLLCEALGLDPPGDGGVVEGLAELDLGEWEGETYASLSAREPERLKAHYADFVRSRPPGGESLLDLARRVRRAAAELRRAARGRTALVVAHAGVNRVILCDALGIPLENFFRVEQDFAALNVIEYHGETPLVRLVNG
ncbi:MAG: histidine phosphatase family protein [Candidatus Tectomicrobia bacterium]|nr:histidine phosphatase family protein [Candidatus Tectomicrobia bacterium]